MLPPLLVVWLLVGFLADNTIANPGSCGIGPHIRIVGGVPANPGDWPWQAQVMTTSGFPFCGGTLVDPQWVVTAAHCVRSGRSIVVRLGSHKRTQEIGNEQKIKVIKIINHPNYNWPKRYANDIALLKLERPAILNRYVNLACLPQAVPGPAENKMCWITGFGRLSSGGAVPNVLQQAQVPIVSRRKCEGAYPGRIHDSMICAGLERGGVDACQGDSGGPIVCQSGGRFYLQGATSWGHGCAAPQKYGVYANIKNLLGWINKEMGVQGPTSSPLPQTPTPPSALAFSCNFDLNMCGLAQLSGDKFDWTRKAGRTPSYGTGPSADHTTNSPAGYYIYIETSYPRRRGDNAKIELPNMKVDENTCLQFYYHMYGRTMGVLNVYEGNNNILSIEGGQGNTWKKANVRLTPSASTTIIFEGVRGYSWRGDIALDDISLGGC